MAQTFRADYSRGAIQRERRDTATRHHQEGYDSDDMHNQCEFEFSTPDALWTPLRRDESGEGFRMTNARKFIKENKIDKYLKYS